jgi:carbon storage regulator
MLVLSRQVGETIFIGHSDSDSWRITIEAIRGDACRISATHHDPLVAQISSVLKRDESVDPDPTTKITVVDIRVDKVRLGVQAPRESSVHRLEVHQAIHRESDAARKIREDLGEDDPEGLAGSRVPRPGSPRPPELEVRLEEPRGEED